MAMTMSALPAQLRTGSPMPYISSPLAATSSHNSMAGPSRGLPKRNPSFPPSRPLRPFASISQSMTKQSGMGSSSKKPVKLIEPPKNFKTTFILDLTQGEFSRQD
ncbi:hypothetical protein BJ138DRAFT_1079419 [Hygrophoropsis aurantiaca]|uniref:Uncharacterized protein n=1 Tax=Hygrophoropsis aurantiaca TaxID=72124 RepID=A0ACB8AP32_9AGAM|nr:hypothetical protein BJ138DRAFT_1079419 [Hygrophoropsis aurantiaca]